MGPLSLAGLGEVSPGCGKKAPVVQQVVKGVGHIRVSGHPGNIGLHQLLSQRGNRRAAPEPVEGSISFLPTQSTTIVDKIT
eukprot:7400423-Pyramimonas_sp.AAC.1